MQAELRASEAKFAGILSIAADAIITVDQTQRIVHFNRGAEEIFGYSAQDAIGRHLNILLPQRFRPFATLGDAQLAPIGPAQLFHVERALLRREAMPQMGGG